MPHIGTRFGGDGARNVRVERGANAALIARESLSEIAAAPAVDRRAAIRCQVARRASRTL
jgi:hypothetical protein